MPNFQHPIANLNLQREMPVGKVSNPLERKDWKNAMPTFSNRVTYQTKIGGEARSIEHEIIVYFVTTNLPIGRPG